MFQDEIQKAQKQEQEMNRKFLQRLFPDIKVSDSLPQEQWVVQIEKSIDKHVKNLAQPKLPEPNLEVPKLKAEIERYKGAIDESVCLVLLF